jgi:dienelactone hydrolase
MFPIHGFPFSTWRTLMANVIRALVSNGFAVATPASIDPNGSRPIRGGMFPGTASTVNGIDLREIATRYLKFFAHASRYLVDLAQSDPRFASPGGLDVSRIGTMGFSVGGALSQYLAQSLDAEFSGPRVVVEVALAPTIGTDVPFTGVDDIGAELFREFASSMTIPTVFVAGENDGMGGLRDAAIYYGQSRAPRVRVIAGNGATHCHAIVPMSECDLARGTRGLQSLDAVVAHAAMTLYLRPDTPRWRVERALARDIIWNDGLEKIRAVTPLAPPNRAWEIREIEREPELSLTVNAYSVSAPLAPRSVELIAVVRSSHTEECGEVRVTTARVPVGIEATVTRLSPTEFGVDVRWTTVPPRSRRAQTRQFLGTWFDARSSDARDGRVSSAFGPRAGFVAPARGVLTIQARHACARPGYAFADVFVNQPYAY